MYFNQIIYLLVLRIGHPVSYNNISSQFLNEKLISDLINKFKGNYPIRRIRSSVLEKNVFQLSSLAALLMRVLITTTMIILSMVEWQMIKKKSMTVFVHS